jgi:membrane protein YdbS with pleckstrin-like domain
MGSGPDSPVGPDDPDRERRDRDAERAGEASAEPEPDGGDGTGSYTEGPAEGEPGWEEETHVLHTSRVGVGGPDDFPGQDPADYGPPPGRTGEPIAISEEELAGLRFDDRGVPIGPRRVMPLEDEPSSLVARYLFPTERYRGEWKRHWIHLWIAFVVGALATLLLGYLSGFTTREEQPGLTTVIVLIWLIVMFWVAWRVADWYYDRFILTNKRVMVVNGIVTRRVAMMPLLRVTDMKYEQSPLGRILNYGTFVLESAGQEQALREVKHVPNPNELYLRVVEEMYEPQAVEARLGRSADEARAEDA